MTLMPTNPATTYHSPKGRPFRVSGLGRSGQGWRVTIQFLDTKKFAYIFYDRNDRFVKIEN